MTAKRRWCCKKYSESQESNDGKPDISWSSSNSDLETEADIKKLKVKSPSWIKLIKSTNSSSSSDDIENILGSTETELQISPSTNDSDSEIVIIQEFSPDIHETDRKQETSPVIGGKNVLKKLKKKLKFIRENKITEIITPPSCSPELFNPSESNAIIESNSSVNLKSFSAISSAKSDDSPKYKIDSFSRQGSSSINIVSTTDSSVNSDPKLMLYHQLPPRKRFRKGGLRSRLERVLNQQKSSLAIWQHELYLNKSKDEIPSCSTQDGNSVKFCIINTWKEYSCTIVECNEAIENDKSKDLFLLIIGYNIIPNISFHLGYFYKILPPFDVKVIKHKYREIKCYYNVYKIVKC